MDDRTVTPGSHSVAGFLRYKDLVARGIVNNRMTLRRWIEAGRFPKPIDLGPNTRAWPEDEIAAWADELRARRGKERGGT